MFKSEALEFPYVETLPKREKSKVVKVWDLFQEMSRVTDEKGMLVPQSLVAKVLDVSRQRIHDLVKQGGLETHDVFGVPFVTERSVVAYAKSERKAGRPMKVESTFNRSLAWAKENKR